MINSIVAKRYAKALFAIGRKSGTQELSQWGASLQGISDVMAANPNLGSLFKNPVIKIAEKKAVISNILQKAGVAKSVGNFCSLLADKNRLGILPEINIVFTSLLDAESGIMRGEITTAIELDAAKQKNIAAELEKKAGKKLYLDFQTDKSILGGIVLKVGDRVLDASLKAQLGILRETIKRGE